MIKRTLLTGVGTIIFVFGIVLFPLPGPFGLPTMAIGLTILLKASNRIKRLTINLVRKNRLTSALWRKTREFHRRIRSPKIVIK
ncbi:PGPGW domain-containing protein [Nitrosomonas marina]|uniref:Putative transmembrane protein (PGPGW) n=1 Tax=Nitrosomonas marina TaxID=917 RepID=A0A1H8BDK3_9PROT|nr:PGPGW domain-containing protein [Nitrosomonas marina]SEM80194.1 Putative transmembrane protein (PGPGW) [Nitrosomonas marina]